MSEDIKLHTAKRSAIISSLSLFFQSGYSAVLGLAANLVLTILLTPAIFGIYITTLSIISLFNYFSDFGLAASLIQKREINDKDLATTFTAQQILIATLILIGITATPFIRSFYKLPTEGIYLYWALLGSFFLSSLKTIPSILLERKIQFQKIVLVQIIENTLFYLTVIILALLNYGLFSFTYAVILRSVVGLIAIYSLSFWSPRIGISRASLKELLSFGIPFQASSFLAIFKDDLIILYLGRVLGFEGVGYIGWAKKWAEAVIRIIMDNISKVIFPLVARFQENPKVIKSLVEKILYYQAFLLIPAIIGQILVMGPVTEVLPNYAKWQPALTAFYIFSLSSLLVSFGAPFINLFNALGKVKTSFTFMAVFTGLTWLLTPALVQRFGFVGFPMAHLLVSASYLFVVLKARSLIDFAFFRPIMKFIFAATLMGVVVYFTQFIMDQNIATVIVRVLLGTATYLAALVLFFKTNIVREIRNLYEKKSLAD